MIDTIKTLLNKTSALEEEISTLSETSQKTSETNGYICFNKNLINYSILSKQKISIAKIEVVKNSSLYFQTMVELNLSSSQKVTFSLIANNISIYKSTKSLSSGFNQITLMKSYTPLTSEEVDISLEITPIEEKQLLIENISLSVWGLASTQEITKYQVLELENEFLLAFLNNNYIYFTRTEKQDSINNSEDFVPYKSAKSFSYAYLAETKQLFLFRVDLSGRLFYSNTDDENEYFVTSNVSAVSACSSENSILVTYIKNGYCYYIELFDNSFSIEKQIYCNSKALSDVYCYFNKYSNKFYVLMSDSNNSNFLVESASETKSFGENLSAKINLSITSYYAEAENEV
jgi:hypothetical protein